MPFQQGNDWSPERIQFAGTPGPLALLVSWLIDPPLDGLGIQLEFRSDLRGFQSLLVVKPAQLAERFVVDYFGPPSKARRRTSATD
jgi:hypothetical protein